MSLSKWIKCIKRTLGDEDCAIRDIVQSKKHLKIYTVLPNGKERMFVTCITPTDNRKVLLNFRGDVRRAVRNE